MRSRCIKRYRNITAAAVEISPLYALDADELSDKIQAGTEFDGPVNLRE